MKSCSSYIFIEGNRFSLPEISRKFELSPNHKGIGMFLSK